jgi:V8-like Glu-specific endopeptidase
MLKNKKQWLLTLLAGSSYLFSLTAITQALPQAQAQGSPNNNASAIGRDVKTGTTQGIGSSNQKTSSATSSVSGFTPGSSVNALAESRIGAKPRSIIGSDNRTKITNTTTYPWSTITKLYVTFPYGKKVCSGAMIAAKYTITTGQCVYDSSLGGWAKSAEVIPGLQGSYRPYGTAYATYFRTYTNWTSSKDQNYDIGLITLDRNIGNSTGWLGYANYSSVNGLTGHLVGYPTDKDGGLYPYYDYGSIYSSTAYRLYYPMDTYGQTGSPIYRIYNNQRYVFGVHGYNATSSYPYNSGTRIDSYKYNDLKSWINSGY